MGGIVPKMSDWMSTIQSDIAKNAFDSTLKIESQLKATCPSTT